MSFFLSSWGFFRLPNRSDFGDILRGSLLRPFCGQFLSILMKKKFTDIRHCLDPKYPIHSIRIITLKNTQFPGSVGGATVRNQRVGTMPNLGLGQGLSQPPSSLGIPSHSQISKPSANPACHRLYQFKNTRGTTKTIPRTTNTTFTLKIQ